MCNECINDNRKHTKTAKQTLSIYMYLDSISNDVQRMCTSSSHLQVHIECMFSIAGFVNRMCCFQWGRSLYGVHLPKTKKYLHTHFMQSGKILTHLLFRENWQTHLHTFTWFCFVYTIWQNVHTLTL